MAGVAEYIVTGANGQVGKALLKILGSQAVGLSREDLDLSSPDSIKEVLDKFSPKYIINAAAYTAVDKAEEEQDLAYKVNSDAVAEIAKYAFSKGIPIVHYSTDYVFPGGGETPWHEDNEVGPLNAYGKSKLAGEEKVQELSAEYDVPKWLIFRTSWVYDEGEKNFVNTMLRLGKDREVISVVSDQVGAPTYAGDIAEFSLKALEKAEEMNEFPSGVYHLCNKGEVNWHGFAEEIFRETIALGETLEIKEVKEIGTADYPTPAARPLNSRMDMTKLKEVFDIEMPDWQNALNRCLKNRKAG